MKKNLLFALAAGSMLMANAGSGRLNNWNSNPNWGGANGDWSGADGVGGGEVSSQQPYIIQVANSCSSTAVSNVDIGNSFLNRAAENFNQSSLISITSTVTEISYLEMLASTESNPFTVGKVMIISSNTSQIEQTIQVNHKTPAGKQDSFVISSTLSPFQNLTDRIIDETVWVFDGFARFRFNSILAGATVTVRFYLKNKFAASQILSDRSGVKNYDNPNLIGVGPVLVGGQAMPNNG